MNAAELRAQQRAAVLQAVTEHPGHTAYALSLAVPVPPPSPPADDQLPMGVPALPVRSASLSLVMTLLDGLTRDGLIRAEPDPRGQRFYPVPTAGTGSEEALRAYRRANPDYRG